VLYLDFWNSFWNEWSDTTQGAEKRESGATPASSSNVTPEDKYDYLAEYGTQILCLISADKGCTYLSRNFETITGNACEALLGNRFYSVVHEDYHERLQQFLASRAEKPQQLRCKIQHADKKYQWYTLMLHPKNEGEKGEFVCIIENINETMIAQNTLQKARLEAELALRSRSEFLANMSHELRTPLNAVIGFSQIIESGIFGKIENPQYNDYIRHIQESGYDLLAKIEDLLEIANIDAGRVTLSKEEVHVGDILRHVSEAQGHHAHSAKIFLESSPLKNEILLYVDRLKLQHILGHLVANAIKFSKPEAHIRMQAAMHKGELQLSIQDTGKGMEESKLSAITAALQEDNCWTTANDNRTIGLGLALTREFVALHGGQVTVHSVAGAGTTVTITLPKECIRASALPKADYLRQVSVGS
jgi:PAS domain S-box-containing protein